MQQTLITCHSRHANLPELIKSKSFKDFVKNSKFFKGINQKIFLKFLDSRQSILIPLNHSNEFPTNEALKTPECLTIPGSSYIRQWKIESKSLILFHSWKHPEALTLINFHRLELFFVSYSAILIIYKNEK